MEARFANGSSVTRIWCDHATELLACFQYSADALAFANLKAADETRPDSVRYLVYCHQDGQSKIVAPPSAKKEAA